MKIIRKEHTLIRKNSMMGVKEAIRDTWTKESRLADI